MDRMIDPQLPWGCWLHFTDLNGRPRFLDDRTGETWPSLRAALWNGRLGMADYNREAQPELLELMHAVLSACARRKPYPIEQEDDAFQGSSTFRKMFHLWLHSHRLATIEENGHYIEELTAEGWAVLHMLAATRPYDVRANRPTGLTVRMLTEFGLGPEVGEARYARVEAEATRWHAAFLRRDEAGRSTIVLNQRTSGPVPVMRTVWSLSFPTARKRDRFYGWLCDRLDRWQAWSELASEYSSDKLTHHLLSVIASSLEEEDNPPTALQRGEVS